MTALMLLVVGSARLALAQTYVAIDFPGATITEPNKINDSGVIVGFWRPADSIANGFMDVGGTLSLFNYPEAYATQAHRINNAGAIVGQIRLDASSPHQGFLYNGSSFSLINYPGANETVAQDPNNLGDVGGYYVTATGTEYGFLWRAGTFVGYADPKSHCAVTGVTAEWVLLR